MTTIARPTFVVHVGDDGQPWIRIEPGPQSSPITDSSYGFQLAPGTSRADAEQVAKYLGEKLEYFIKL
ncbi:hypothetical protein DBB42_26260 [Pseudomonas plecoglossicida]|uniref:Uncharacterized protein n=1 Tax=Pseudomonas plecoglossicida TaxID=70775 RepID=A0A2R7UB75_PSEDL|nr:hypothetical protein DBB42_26260 [Pseudomonas plecoglossicida]